LYELDIRTNQLSTSRRYFECYVEFIREALQCDLTSSTPLRLIFSRARDHKASTIMAGFENGSFNWSYIRNLPYLCSNFPLERVDSVKDYFSRQGLSTSLPTPLTLSTISEETDSGLSDESNLATEKNYNNESEEDVNERSLEGGGKGYFKYLLQSSESRSYLLDGAVKAMAMYSLRPEKTTKKVLSDDENFNDLAKEWDYSIAIGLDSGAVALLAPKEGQLKLLQSRSLSGSAQSIAVGDVTKNCINDVIVGFEDGTLVVYSINHIGCTENFRPTASNSLVINEIWRLKLPFPIVCIEFGRLVQHSTRDAFESQIAVLTSNSVHLFTLDDSN